MRPVIEDGDRLTLYALIGTLKKTMKNRA